jgi:hypothetical protein
VQASTLADSCAAFCTASSSSVALSAAAWALQGVLALLTCISDALGTPLKENQQFIFICHASLAGESTCRGCGVDVYEGIHSCIVIGSLSAVAFHRVLHNST